IEAEPMEISRTEKDAVQELIGSIRGAEDEERLQNRIFETARGHGLSPNQFFRLLYMLLIGSTSGPRLGTYIFDIGQERAAETLANRLKEVKITDSKP
ncbi:hypothetical protein KEJ23_01710, partial [Candidatus Bathyarchaeota archaeon]|nr:hypothetical protein [Candidatus Bathyarchaeota archaeon]